MRAVSRDAMPVGPSVGPPSVTPTAVTTPARPRNSTPPGTPDSGQDRPSTAPVVAGFDHGIAQKDQDALVGQMQGYQQRLMTGRNALQEVPATAAAWVEVERDLVKNMPSDWRAGLAYRAKVNWVRARRMEAQANLGPHRSRTLFQDKKMLSSDLMQTMQLPGLEGIPDKEAWTARQLAAIAKADSPQQVAEIYGRAMDFVGRYAESAEAASMERARQSLIAAREKPEEPEPTPAERGAAEAIEDIAKAQELYKPGGETIQGAYMDWTLAAQNAYREKVRKHQKALDDYAAERAAFDEALAKQREWAEKDRAFMEEEGAPEPGEEPDVPDAPGVPPTPMAEMLPEFQSAALQEAVESIAPRYKGISLRFLLAERARRQQE